MGRAAARPAQQRIVVLDGFRAVAILAVLGFHYTVRWAPPQDPAAHLPAGMIFNDVVPLQYGRMGVEFFFVISGYVILMTLERCRSVGDFVLRRFARLWPMLLVSATLTYCVVNRIGPPDWRVGSLDYLASVLLLDPTTWAGLLHDPRLEWVDRAYWSLLVEVHFYALAAAVYLVARRRFVICWLGIQCMTSIAAAAAHAGIAPSLMAFVPFPNSMPFFTLGICLYEIDTRGALRRLAIAGAVLAAAAALLSVALGGLDQTSNQPVGIVVVIFLIFGLSILFAIDHPIVRLFGYRPLALLGEASYSLYLIHQVVGISVMRALVGLGVPYLLALPVVAGGAIGSALLLHRFIEVPAKSLILTRSKGLVARLELHVPWLRYSEA